MNRKQRYQLTKEKNESDMICEKIIDTNPPNKTTTIEEDKDTGRYKAEIKALKQQLHIDRETHQKEIALVREDAQIERLHLEKINRVVKIAKDKNV